MFYAGIDYSMNSPAICVYDGDKELKFDNCLFFVYSTKKQSMDRSNVFFEKQEKYDCQEDRFNSISEWAVRILKRYEIKKVGLEGYSYGSKSSSLFDIGENGGVLKHKMWLEKIYFSIFSPPDVKKSFAGKGNAKKEMMHQFLTEKEGVYLGENSESPVSDIIDSYAILRRLMTSIS